MCSETHALAGISTLAAFCCATSPQVLTRHKQPAGQVPGLAVAHPLPMMALNIKYRQHQGQAGMLSSAARAQACGKDTASNEFVRYVVK